MQKKPSTFKPELIEMQITKCGEMEEDSTRRSLVVKVPILG